MNRCPGCKRTVATKGRNYCRPCGADYQRVRRALIRAAASAEGWRA